MSWIRDISDDLVNLDRVQSLDVIEVEGAEEATHGIIADLGKEDNPILFTGDEAECRKKLDLIATKLPMVRV